MDRGAWWTIAHGVAESDTTAKRSDSVELCLQRSAFVEMANQGKTLKLT